MPVGSRSVSAETSARFRVGFWAGVIAAGGREGWLGGLGALRVARTRPGSPPTPGPDRGRGGRQAAGAPEGMSISVPERPKSPHPPPGPTRSALGLFAALFTVAYLAFGVPVIIAGQLIPRVGLLPAIIGYGVVNVVAGAAGLAAQSFRGATRAAVRS